MYPDLKTCEKIDLPTKPEKTNKETFKHKQHYKAKRWL